VLELSERALTLLDQSPIGRLATVDRSGEAFAVPICFLVDGNLVYSVIDEKPKRTLHLKRVRNIEETGRATLIVDHYEDNWQQLGWAMLRGNATIVEPGTEHAVAVASLRDRYQQYLTMALDEAPVIRIEVDHATEWWAASIS
jgi:PPOX class probable F420-dependent enzyme